MNKFLEFQGISVAVIYAPKLKHSYLRVKADATLSVKTPIKSIEFVYKFLDDKSDWIKKQLLKNRQNSLPKIRLEEEVLFFGEIYSIHSEEVISLHKQLLKFNKGDSLKISKAYDIFYKRSAEEYLTKRVEYFSAMMHLEYSALKFRKMKSRWGSCNSKKEITLNTQLMKLTKELIDYVVVHELSHLVHMNHSKEFHSFVDSYLANSKNLRARLKEVHLVD